MKKNKLLLCLGDLPFPARKNGYSVRYFPIIQHFSQHFDLDIFVRASWDIPEEDILLAAKYCNNISIYQHQKVDISLFSKIVARVKSLAPGATPFDFVYHDQPQQEAFFEKKVGDLHYDLIVCASITLVDMIRKYAHYDRLTLDVIDSPYALKSREAKTIFQKIDTRLIRYWERKIISEIDHVSYISPLDRKIACGEKPHNNVSVIPNGVYLEDVVDDPVSFGALSIGFLGNMGYSPNIKAAKRLFGIFKIVQTYFPTLKLVIIGRDPTPEIIDLASDPAVIITGTVENIWPYVCGVDLFVFPMISGSGQQNKLLEAMAARKPVVATSLCNSGVCAIDGMSITVTDTDEAIVENLKTMLSSSEARLKMGQLAYEFVINTYSWSTIFKQLESSLFLVSDKK